MKQKDYSKISKLCSKNYVRCATDVLHKGRLRCSLCLVLYECISDRLRNSKSRNWNETETEMFVFYPLSIVSLGKSMRPSAFSTQKKRLKSMKVRNSSENQV